ncbi:ABC transporter C-terminal domain-containing protein, partial [Leucobacter sp. M11]
SAPAGAELSGAERRALEKEVSSAERKIAKLDGEIKKLHARMAAHDQADYAGLGELTAQIQGLGDEIAEAEERWVEASDRLGN